MVGRPTPARAATPSMVRPPYPCSCRISRVAARIAWSWRASRGRPGPRDSGGAGSAPGSWSSRRAPRAMPIDYSHLRNLFAQFRIPDVTIHRRSKWCRDAILVRKPLIGHEKLPLRSRRHELSDEALLARSRPSDPTRNVRVRRDGFSAGCSGWPSRSWARPAPPRTSPRKRCFERGVTLRASTRVGEAS